MSGLRGFSDSVGGYWSADNARFEATKPGLGRRVVRALNPVTGFGSAIGGVYDAAQAGDVPRMALNAVAATPMFGYARYGKVPEGVAPVVEQGLRNWRLQAAQQAAASAYPPPDAVIGQALGTAVGKAVRSNEFENYQRRRAESAPARLPPNVGR